MKKSVLLACTMLVAFSASTALAFNPRTQYRMRPTIEINLDALNNLHQEEAPTPIAGQADVSPFGEQSAADKGKHKHATHKRKHKKHAVKHKKKATACPPVQPEKTETTPEVKVTPAHEAPSSPPESENVPQLAPLPGREVSPPVAPAPKAPVAAEPPHAELPLPAKKGDVTPPAMPEPSQKVQPLALPEPASPAPVAPSLPPVAPGAAKAPTPPAPAVNSEPPSLPLAALPKEPAGGLPPLPGEKAAPGEKELPSMPGGEALPSLPGAKNAPAAGAAALPPLPGASADKDEAAAGSATAPDERIVFNSNATELPLGATAKLDMIATQLTAHTNMRANVVAYASGSDAVSIYPKRVSLARGIAVRNYLVTTKGIDVGRVNVKALGNKNESGPADRVDVFIIK
ncbi:MAG TPA: OmpA family protein [Rickettsiales bacterium]|nr:OmpA family protein [Rickettsiales bacterium]